MMQWVVGGLAAAGAAASARFTWWRKSVEGLSVLMYHKIGKPPHPSLKQLWVSTEDFERQMAWLSKGGYNPIRFTDLERSVRTGEPLPAKPVLVTFDDGYRNNFLEAFPALQKHNVPAGIFLVYETIGRHNQWHSPETEPWLSMLRWEDIKEMADSKLVEFGSHTMRHRNLGTAPLEEAKWELEESKARFEDKLGHEMPFFAYPYGGGADDPAVREAVLKAGYRFDFGIRHDKTAMPWSARQGAIPRLFIRWGDTMVDFKLKLEKVNSRMWSESL